jgi:cytochrome d ubiquinol oxidase subunit II
MPLDLPLLSALVAGAALCFYVLLDGFDLGIGALLLFRRDEAARDQLVFSIAPTWDGNETWLIMAGVVLLAAFPIAYGILLPALYLPLIVMLLALGLRGAAFELRFQTVEWRRFWDYAFGLGSIVASLAQGLIAGALVKGVAVEGERFAGGPLDAFGAFPLLCGAGLLAGYVVLGCGWLIAKTDGANQAFARDVLARAAPAFAVLGLAIAFTATLVQPGMADAWDRHMAPMLAGVCAFAGLAVGAGVAGRRAGDWLPLRLGFGAFAAGALALALSIFPDVVPFRLSLWAAASPTLSHVFLLIGFAVVAPMVLAYSAFAYRVFRGKTPTEGWEA